MSSSHHYYSKEDRSVAFEKITEYFLRRTNKEYRRLKESQENAALVRSLRIQLKSLRDNSNTLWDDHAVLSENYDLLVKSTDMLLKELKSTTQQLKDVRALLRATVIKLEQERERFNHVDIIINDQPERHSPISSTKALG